MVQCLAEQLMSPTRHQLRINTHQECWPQGFIPCLLKVYILKPSQVTGIRTISSRTLGVGMDYRDLHHNANDYTVILLVSSW
jgi:hypothetical protein